MQYSRRSLMQNLFEVFSEANTGSSSLGVKYAGMRPDDAVALFMRTDVDPYLVKLFDKYHAEILRVRPNMGQTLKNWWQGIKNFAGRYWNWNRRESLEYLPEAYNFKLYSLTNKYVHMLYEETNPYDLVEVLNRFRDELRQMISVELHKIFIFGREAKKETPEIIPGEPPPAPGEPPAAPPVPV